MVKTATSPWTKAERCFAVARSTTFPGERDNAIAQGTRIAEAAGLDLDTFDIPGRTPSKVKADAKPAQGHPRYRWESQSDPRPRDHPFSDAFRDFAFDADFKRQAEEMLRRDEAARAKRTRDAYEATIKAAKEKVSKQRERVAETHARLAEAVAGVAWRFGVHVEEHKGPTGRVWNVTGPDGSTLWNVTDPRLYQLAPSW